MILPKSSRFLPTPDEPLKVSGLFSGLAVLSISIAALVLPALFEILDGGVGLEHFVRVRAAFGAFDARGHRALDRPAPCGRLSVKARREAV